MRIPSYVVTLSLLSLIGSAVSQNPTTDPFSQPNGLGQWVRKSEGAILTLNVLGKTGKPLDRQAVVKVFNQTEQTSMWQTTTTEGVAEFRDLQRAPYDVEVSAVGFLTDRQHIVVGGNVSGYHIDSHLEPDPAAVDLEKPFDKSVPRKSRKQIQKGVIALRSGDYSHAQKHLTSALKDLPSSSDVNFLLGYLYLQRQQFDLAQNYLGAAATLDPKNAQVLTLLGRVNLHAQRLDVAQKTLEQAVALANDYWQAHSLLAEVYLKEGAYEKAREQAQSAIDTSKGGGAPAYLTLGQALTNLGRNRESLDALQTYAQYNPKNPVLPQVKEYMAQVERSIANPPVTHTAPRLIANIDASAEQETDELRLSIKNWHPPGVDEQKPVLASGVTCPSETVIKEAGDRIKELVEDVVRFSAIEHLSHEELDELGNATTRETRQFNYLVQISQTDPGFVDEYRSAREGLADFPAHIATRGLPTLALVFHPAMRDSFQMTCEGLGEWQGRATWLVYFRQREDRPNRIRLYKIGDATYPVNLKGRAWISSDKYQIVRIESELVRPLRTITLLSEYLSVDYGPVQFPRRNTELWLPKRADLYVDFRRRRFHRSHSFGNFMLFSVDSQEKRKEPTAPPPAEPQQQ